VKVSLSNETTGAMFEQPLAMAPPMELASEGLSVTPWSQALPLWRAALSRLSGASFYHCESWIEALREAYGLKLEVASLHRHGRLCAAVVLARSKGLFSTRLVAMPFSDCAEPLALDDESRAELLRALAAANPSASIEIRGAAGPTPWQNVDCFAQWSLDLTRLASEIKAGFGRTVRTGIKRAMRDQVRIECGTDRVYLERYFELQLITRRRLGVPPQPFKFFDVVHNKFSRTGDIEIRFATFEGRDHAGSILLRAGGRLCYKWAARLEDCHPGANHLLVADMIEAHAQRATTMDLGRCDVRNQGLIRSKADIGCVSRPLPYAFYPKAPRQISSEVLSGPAKIVSSIWKRLPLPVTRVMGELLYRYMA
jgi:hypothetical protein